MVEEFEDEEESLEEVVGFAIVNFEETVESDFLLNAFFDVREFFVSKLPESESEGWDFFNDTEEEVFNLSESKTSLLEIDKEVFSPDKIAKRALSSCLRIIENISFSLIHFESEKSFLKTIALSGISPNINTIL